MTNVISAPLNDRGVVAERSRSPAFRLRSMTGEWWLSGAETRWLSGAETRWLSGAETRWLSGAETRWLSGAETRWLSGAETRWLSGAEALFPYMLRIVPPLLQTGLHIFGNGAFKAHKFFGNGMHKT